jgi:hypothetical protein
VKALWYQQRHGTKEKLRKIRRIQPLSKIRNKAMRVYAFQARLWKEGRECECAGLKDSTGRTICANRPHLCSEVHHRRGRAGKLLLDTRFWVALCDKSHRFVHDNPAEARAIGLIEGPWNHQPK